MHEGGALHPKCESENVWMGSVWVRGGSLLKAVREVLVIPSSR